VVKTLGFIAVIVTATLTMASAQAGDARDHAVQAIPLVTPLENVHDPLQRALRSLTRAANQSCGVKRAIVDVKVALREVSAAEAFLAAHDDARVTSPLPPDVAPDFAPERPPAPRRNAMLDAAMRDLDRAFQRLANAPGGALDGHRDSAYHRIAAAAAHLRLAIAAANAAFARGAREVPDCGVESDRLTSGN
jgi:hypothetical protein